jgi:hypothetical protein
VLRAISFVVFAITISVGAAAAQAPRVSGCEIVERGIYDLKTVKQVPSSSIASGTFVESKGKLVRSTSVIPARLGMAFGYQLKLVGSPVGASVTVNDVNIVPEPGLRNPKTGDTVFREEASYTRRIGDRWISDYQLNYGWTLLPGRWTFQIWVDGQKVCEQIFTLEKQ